MMVHRWLKIAIVAGAATAASCRSDPGTIGQGTVEVNEALISPRVPTTVVQILVNEGDSVAAGDTLALLAQSDLAAVIAGRIAELNSARAALKDLQAGAREAELKRARALVDAAEAEVANSRNYLDRIERLATSNAASRQAWDDATARNLQARSRYDAALEELRLLEAGTRPEQIAAAQSRVQAAIAAVEVSRALETDLILGAPFAGRILSRLSDPGEFLNPGVPALSLGETGKPWVRVWFSAKVTMGLALGDSAMIETDLGGTPARITAVAPRAEFTPRVALTETEREDLLFAVKVEPVAATPWLRPGLWVRVRVFPQVVP